MPRAQTKATKPPAPHRYAAPGPDPVHSLAEQLGRFVVAEVRQFRPPVKTPPKGRPGAAAEMKQLEAEICLLIGKALDLTLSSQTTEGKALRMGLIAKLASAELGQAPAVESLPASASDILLTTAQAAELLDVSRPYVAMLCDQGKLGQIVATEGGHRRIRSSAVQAYLAARTRQYEGAPTPREAAEAAGLYDLPEGHFKNVVRTMSPAAEAPKKRAPRKTRV